MFAGVLAGRWPPAATLVDRLLGPEHALPLRPATDRAVRGPGGTVDPCTVEVIAAVAADERGTPWPAATARAYARYHTDGDRTEYEAAVSGRQQRLSRAAVMAAHTLEPSAVHEVADGVVVLCEQSSWCRPAHDDTFTRYGSVLPTVTDPYLDLGAGEVAGQLAWLDHLLGDVLDEHVPADVWLPSTQVLVARRKAGTADGLTLAVKGGHNGEHHNDVGSVVVAAGVDQAPGRRFAASDVIPELGADRAGLALDIAAAYPLEGIPADLKSRELTDPMLCDVRGERITRLDPTVAARAGTLTIHITEATR